MKSRIFLSLNVRVGCSLVLFFADYHNDRTTKNNPTLRAIKKRFAVNFTLKPEA